MRPYDSPPRPPCTPHFPSSSCLSFLVFLSRHSPVELTEGEEGRGWARSQIIQPRESLAIQSFNHSILSAWTCLSQQHTQSENFAALADCFFFVKHEQIFVVEYFFSLWISNFLAYKPREQVAGVNSNSHVDRHSVLVSHLHKRIHCDFSVLKGV